MIPGFQLRHICFIDRDCRAKPTAPEIPFSGIDEPGGRDGSVFGSTVTDNSKPATEALYSAEARVPEICGGMAKSRAKLLCPVEAGNLRNSISHLTGGEDTLISRQPISIKSDSSDSYIQGGKEHMNMV